MLESPLRVLCVDDRPAERAMVSEALDRAEFPCVVAEAEGIPALRAVLTGSPMDVVITDFELGAGDGLEVLNLVRAAWPDTPVVFVASSASEETAIEALRHGVDEYVVRNDSFDMSLPLRLTAACHRTTLRLMRDRLAAIVEEAPDLIGWAGPDGRIEYLNPGGERLLGRQLKELRGMHVSDLRGDEKMLTAARAHSDRHGRWSGETEIVAADGSTVPVQQTILTHRDRAGRVTHRSTIAHDLRPIRDAERWRQVVLDALPARIVLLSDDGRILEANRRWTDYASEWGYPDAGRGDSYLAVCERSAAAGDADAGLVLEGLRAILAGTADEFVHQYACAEPGRPDAWYEMRATRAGDGHDGMVIAHFDVTDQRRLDHLVNHDRLTGLPNRFQLKQRMEAALARARRAGTHAGVLSLDLNAFTNVNDSLGMAVGDLLLQEVAARLAGVLRDGDLLARLGSDEFAVLVEDLRSPEMAGRIAEKLLACLEPSMTLDGHELVVNACVGVACFPEDGADVDTLLRNADTALHKAKVSGPGTIQFFAAEMNARALEALVLQANLRTAIENDQLVLHFQPIVALDDDRVVGVEALVRWRHPEFGMVPPDRFIPIAEQTGLIVPIGEWVLREALQQLVEWRSRGFTGYVAVNLSMRQFHDPGLGTMVAGTLRDSGCPPYALRIELTESMLSADPEAARQVLTELAEIGIEVAVDDFGTGYSSLSYLNAFPLNVLKIDRSFIRNLPDAASDLAIVHAIIELAHALGLKVVAEGVETAAQRTVLAEAGCDTAQGYLFAKPLPAGACGEFLLTV